MTLEYVLKAAVRSIAQGRQPHCFSAYVPGQGYVNDGTIEATRADYIRQARRAAQSAIDNMGFAPAYAEPGYTQPAHGVLMADWNTLPSDLIDVVEALDYAIEWSDEWTTCEGCDRAVRTQPDSYDWAPAYEHEDDSTIVCKQCAVPAVGRQGGT